jgi:hypothetical protein
VQPRVAAWDRAAAGVRGADLKRDRRARASRQSTQFSPLMSWTTADPSQMSRVGTIKPTPLPERVGAKHSHAPGRGAKIGIEVRSKHFLFFVQDAQHQDRHPNEAPDPDPTRQPKEGPG